MQNALFGTDCKIFMAEILSNKSLQSIVLVTRVQNYFCTIANIPWLFWLVQSRFIWKLITTSLTIWDSWWHSL